MKTNKLISAWKNADATHTPDSPANQLHVEEALMSRITGGADSAGLVCSVSGECNASGKSCWTHLCDFLSGNF